MHERVFRSTFEFDSAYIGILCDTADLDAPNPKADPAMAAIARRFMGSAAVDHSDDLAFNLRKTVHLLLPLGKAKIKQVAPSLGMSVRSLQRSLAKLGLGFSGVVDDVRWEVVQGHLVNRVNQIARVSGMLGYSNTPTFTR